MSIFNLFSKRQRKLRGDEPDVFQYDVIPNTLRAQIIHISRDAIGIDRYPYNSATKIYKSVCNALLREYGMFSLTGRDSVSYQDEIEQFLMHETSTEKVLDGVEILFRVITISVPEEAFSGKLHPSLSVKLSVIELNQRFLENGVGYQFESGQIIRKDSELVHLEAVKPVLHLLNSDEYAGANEEFLKAHEHYRHGHYKESTNECLKSLESVLKTICLKRKWAFKSNDTAKSLIDICFLNKLIPDYLQSQFTALRSVLESGVPTVRNKTSGHGQGQTQSLLPDYFARYTLNLTATSILLLVEAERS